MKIGGAYRLRDIGARQWSKLAAELRLKPDEVIDRVRSMAAGFPDHVADIPRHAGEAGLTHPLIARLAAGLIERAQGCLRLIDLAGTTC